MSLGGSTALSSEENGFRFRLKNELLSSWIGNRSLCGRVMTLPPHAPLGNGGASGRSSAVSISGRLDRPGIDSDVYPCAYDMLAPTMSNDIDAQTTGDGIVVS